MNAINSLAYYEELAKEDYYTGGGEPQGKWIGLGARVLELSEYIENKDYRLIFKGYNSSGVPLCENAGENHRAGWDLTFSAPKSVSILWARADEKLQKSIQSAQQQAVEQAFKFIEKHAAFTRRGKGGFIQEPVTGLVGATFEHSTSRAQDPQLHTHCLIANVGQRHDGSWGTLESKNFFHWQNAISAVYRAQLSKGLRELGFETEAVEGKLHFEVKGICQQVCRFFSKRADAIRALMNKMGVTKASSKIGDVIALNTRGYKKAVNRHKLFFAWQSDMDKQGFQAKNIDEIRQENIDLTAESLPLQQLMDNLIQNKAVFFLQDIYAAVANEAQFHNASLLDIEDTVREMLSDNSLVSLGVDIKNNKIFTTKTMLNMEQSLIKTADVLHTNNQFLLSEKSINEAISIQSHQQGFALSDEQIEAVHSVCQSGLDILQGKAGAGKSTSMRAMKLAYEANGFKVRGATVAKQAALQLQNETGINSTTLASLINELGKGFTKLKDTVILLDEAGQLATPDLLKLMQAVHRSGAKLVLVGEQQQMDAITHGGSLRYLSQRHGYAKISTIRRQRQVWAREAVNDLRHGNARAAIISFQKKGLLHIEENSQLTREKLVSTWQSYIEANPHKASAILAQRWKDVKPLNDLVREVYQQQGKLGNEHIHTECAVSNKTLYFAFSKGERVRLTKNDYKRNYTNGDQGVVLEVKKIEDDIYFKVRLDNGRVVSFMRSEYCDEQGRLNLVQAYATTVYASQGSTVDGDTFVLYTTGMDRAASYVAGSRHKDNCHWFVNGQELDALSGQKDRGEMATLKARIDVLSYSMSINKHKAMASEYIAEQSVDMQMEEKINYELTA